jgi:hypothetical protein
MRPNASKRCVAPAKASEAMPGPAIVVRQDAGADDGDDGGTRPSVPSHKFRLRLLHRASLIPAMCRASPATLELRSMAAG